MKYKTTVHQLINIKELKRLRRADRALKVAGGYLECIAQTSPSGNEAVTIASEGLSRINRDMAKK